LGGLTGTGSVELTKEVLVNIFVVGLVVGVAVGLVVGLLLDKLHRSP